MQRGLLCKPDDSSSIPRAHKIKPDAMACLCNPSIPKVREEMATDKSAQKHAGQLA